MERPLFFDILLLNLLFSIISSIFFFAQWNHFISLDRDRANEQDVQFIAFIHSYDWVYAVNSYNAIFQAVLFNFKGCWKYTQIMLVITFSASATSGIQFIWLHWLASHEAALRVHRCLRWPNLMSLRTGLFLKKKKKEIKKEKKEISLLSIDQDDSSYPKNIIYFCWESALKILVPVSSHVFVWLLCN